MKKLFILTIAILISVSGFAQRSSALHEQSINFIGQNSAPLLPNGRTSGAGDTITLSNFTADTTTIYKTDSGGYVTGTNFYGDKAFAERYDINGQDSSVQVLGVLALFGGKVNAASTKSVYLTAWDQLGPQTITGSLFYNGFPNNVINAVNVPVTQLGIGATVDTLKKFWFPSATLPVGSSFFIGYSINYNYQTLNGDTIGLATSKNGSRSSASFSKLQYNATAYDTTSDTIINVQNAAMGADNTWYDYYTQNDSARFNLAIYPIVLIGIPNGVKAVTRNDLTLFGSYPNPAVNSTNVRFSLAHNTTVTIQLMDMAGKVLCSASKHDLAAGEHVFPLSVAGLPAGDYMYLIRTAAGDGIAGKVSKM